MKKYRIVQRRVDYYEAFIEANSAEEAEDLLADQDTEWTYLKDANNDYENVYTVEVATKSFYCEECEDPVEVTRHCGKGMWSKPAFCTFHDTKMSPADQDQIRSEPLTAREIKMAARQADLACSYCPPNRGENATRKPKHGVKKPKKGRR